jgi:hypothetical protein
MKKNYQEPSVRTYCISVGGMICVSGGKPGGSGQPGAKFDPEEDIYEGGTF